MGSKQTRKAEKPIVQQPVAQLPANYPEMLSGLKNRIRTAQVKAALAVNLKGELSTVVQFQAGLAGPKIPLTEKSSGMQAHPPASRTVKQTCRRRKGVGHGE